MPYLLRFVQKYRPADRDAFMALEAHFAALETQSDLPCGTRMQPYAGRDPANTHIWECRFDSLQEAQDALARIQAHPEHEQLFQKQVPFFLDAWTEIYEILEFSATP